MLHSLSLIVGVTTLCMLSPGPDMVLVMANTLRGDRRSGLLTSLGILTGNFVHIAYCLFGLGWLIANSIAAYATLKLAGAAYLVYLGIHSLRSAGKGELTTETAPRAYRSAYLQGLFNNLLNHKGALFYLGVFTQVIQPGTPAQQAAVLVAAMVATSALFWLVFVYTLHLPKVRTLLSGSRKLIDRAFGALLIALGVRVALER
jgi:RhtB (resistance to homoserine/threonine) family protein